MNKIAFYIMNSGFIKDGMPVIVSSDGLIGLRDIRDKDDNEMFINFRSRFKWVFSQNQKYDKKQEKLK